MVTLRAPLVRALSSVHWQKTHGDDNTSAAQLKAAGGTAYATEYLATEIANATANSDEAVAIGAFGHARNALEAGLRIIASINASIAQEQKFLHMKTTSTIRAPILI